MTGPARVVILCVSALLVLGGVVALARWGHGWAPIVMGALIAASVLLEGRYRGPAGKAPDRGNRAPDRANWQRTGERELDSETGRIVEVWFDPATGQRHYLPASGS